MDALFYFVRPPAVYDVSLHELKLINTITAFISSELSKSGMEQKQKFRMDAT